MKGAYAALKEAVATGASDEKKLGLCADLTQAVQNFDAKMKTVRKNLPSPADANPKAKAKGKAKASAKGASK